MRGRKDDYYLKNGSLDLTMLDGKTQEYKQLKKESQLAEHHGMDENKKLELDNSVQVGTRNYEGHYINLKVDKIPEYKDCNDYTEISTSDETYVLECEEQFENEKPDCVKPYMSEEIHSMLSEMGTYLLEGNDEIVATLDIEVEELEDLEDLDELEEVDKLEDLSELEPIDRLEETTRIEDIYLETYRYKESPEEVLVEQECSKEIDRQSFRLRQYELLEGKVLTDNIISSSGCAIGRQGEIITKYMIQLAEEKKCMIKMIMHSE